jgi:four helix bundle protein
VVPGAGCSCDALERSKLPATPRAGVAKIATLPPAAAANRPQCLNFDLGMERAMRGPMGVQRFEDLFVWQAARKYCADVGRITDTPSFFRDGALRPRMNKTALSILENIAEGFERESLPEFSQFLKVAKGSAGESRAQLYAAKDRGLFQPEEFDTLLDAVTGIGKMLRGLRQSLAKNRPRRQASKPGERPLNDLARTKN